MRQPSLYLPHGGGPCFFMDWPPPNPWAELEAFLRSVPSLLPARPRAILLITAHWIPPQFTLATGTQPSLIYDYYGFPPHTYQLRYDAPGAPDVAAHAVDLLAGAGIGAAGDAEHGWDHGVFIPLKVVFPDADIPVAAMSLRHDLDPAAHIAAGRAVAPLRDDNVLIVGSGMSYHNLRAFFDPAKAGHGEPFDDFLFSAIDGQSEAARTAALARWAAAPGARIAHPQEDHLLPLMVAAGAGGADAGKRIYSGVAMNQPLSAFRFG